jgi:hypothetical protein
MPRPKGSRNKPKAYGPVRIWEEFARMDFHFGEELVELWKHGSTSQRIAIAQLVIKFAATQPVDEAGNSTTQPTLRIVGLDGIAPQTASGGSLEADPERRNGVNGMAPPSG